MLKELPVEQIQVSLDRQRREFNQKGIEDLATSIQDKGLMHPIVLRSDGCTLVAGERRLRALQLLHERGALIRCDGYVVSLYHIPYTLVGDLSPFQLEEAELEENLKREDLTWQERATALTRLHSMRQEQHGKAEIGSQGKGWSATDTITEILGDAKNSDLANFRETKIVAEHLTDPEVANAKSQKEALKIIAKKNAAEHRANLAAEFGKRSSAHRVVNANCLDHMQSLPAASVDLIITDPPYGIGADSFGDQATEVHAYDDSPESFERLLPRAIREFTRLARTNAACYIFCDVRKAFRIIDWLGDNGWRPFQTPLIWNKGTVGMLPWPYAGPRRCYEAIVYAIRGEAKVNSIQSDVISVDGIQAPLFAAEKPVDLYENLLNRSAKPGDVVLDPFAGAGGIIPACNRKQCIAIAIEQNEDKYNHMLSRLEEN